MFNRANRNFGPDDPKPRLNRAQIRTRALGNAARSALTGSGS